MSNVSPGCIVRGNAGTPFTEKPGALGKRGSLESIRLEIVTGSRPQDSIVSIPLSDPPTPVAPRFRGLGRAQTAGATPSPQAAMRMLGAVAASVVITKAPLSGPPSSGA